jgi:hypothetical protein
MEARQGAPLWTGVRFVANQWVAMRSIFAVLKLVQVKPEFYLGTQGRSAQFEALSSLLKGYEIALEQHDVRERGRNFLTRFGEFVERRYRLERSPFEVARMVSHSDDEAWELFFELVWEFRETTATVDEAVVERLGAPSLRRGPLKASLWN